MAKRERVHKIKYKFEGLQMTPKEKKERIKILKKEYLEGNFRRFLMKHYKRYWYETVYSVTLKKWKKEDKEGAKAVKWLLKECQWPSQVVKVANILYTLEKHFDWRVNVKNMRIAYAIWDYLDEDYIRPYMSKRYSKSITEKIRTLDYFNPTEKAAFREQKARGFIHINDYEDFQKDKHHVYSNIDKDYIYPMNLGMTNDDRKERYNNLYVTHALVGVRGWTRAQVNQKVLHQN